jgi:nucleotide-binding universal stress UspA family protein
MEIHKILVPVDFSPCSLLVVGQAASLASQLKASVTLLHIAELTIPPDSLVRPDGQPIQVERYLIEGAKNGMDAMVAEAKRHNVDVQAIVKAETAVVQGILEVCRTEHSDLIVLGTHGRSGLARVLLGSVAEGVSHQAKVPVLLIRREVRPECGRASCDWCSERGLSKAEETILAEKDG